VSEDEVTTDAWLLKLVGACDSALERLDPSDPQLADLRADVADLRSTIQARLAEHGDG
jgi:hypothetical protein